MHWQMAFLTTKNLLTILFYQLKNILFSLMIGHINPNLFYLPLNCV